MTDTDPKPPTRYEDVIPQRLDDPLIDRRASRTRGLPLAIEELPYEVENRPEPPPVPNGWYALAGSSEIEPGEALSAIACARELVVFRGADNGEVSVLDAHCPHLGAHLGGGEIKGDTIACPYHGWQFEGSGRCVEIPYSDSRIPSKACVKSYPSREINGMILFWYHAGGAEPNYEVPEIPELDDADYGEPHIFETEFHSALQDMAENNVDYTHFHFVHRRAALDDSTSKFTTDGPFSKVVEVFDEEGLMPFTRWTYGPGIAYLRVPDLMTVLTATTPIDRRHVRLLWQFYLPSAMESVADDIVDGVTGSYGVTADVPIWRDKVFRDQPVLVKGDGPVHKFRKWYAQFYEGN
ncbi:MAG: Rieske 2Fe-2S domain-containing protein [Actinomycetia bacterium]|nr:Rieske 2Fe-2S domain-containing protein [Actinomycetes bacterium]